MHELAGKKAPPELLVDLSRLISAYFDVRPDPAERDQRVSFGTSGHRGSSLKASFNESHILAVSQAVAECRRGLGLDGPLYLAKDTHALSEPAFVTALEVFAGNGVDVRIPQGGGFTPTPVLSHAILTHNRDRSAGLADGVVITPSHNPPEDGGFKYNPPSGGPADTGTTRTIEARANEILAGGLKDVRRHPFAKALKAPTTCEHDFVAPYVRDLASVVDLRTVARESVTIGVDPLGGSSVHLWEPIAERYGLKLEVVNEEVDPAFAFMTVDRDGRIRMDCSSPSAMAGLIAMRDRFDIAFGTDPDADRHGIVTRGAGLLNPNHYLAAAISHLFRHRPEWPRTTAVGKTLVSSAIIDRLANDLGRPLVEVPVGFKWFVDGLLAGGLGFAGEESAGATFLRRDGSVWTTDKDGIILGLLAAEITAVTGRDPGDLYRDIEERLGRPVYERIDSPATAEQKEALKSLSPEAIGTRDLAGDSITAVLTRAPGNGAAIGGVKVVTANGWFAARPSGTENVYKIYAESFVGREHLGRIQQEAREMVSEAFRRAGAR